jgi:fructokinase
VITVVGEALVDLVSSGQQGFRALPGGAPMNVAVGLARLGCPVSLLARISEDGFGRMLREHILGNGVSERDLVTAPEQTTLAVAMLDDEGRAEYDFYVQGTADWHWTDAELPDPLPADVTALYAGSLAVSLAPGGPRIEALLRRERERGAVTLVYDPNIRPALADSRAAEVARVERQVALTGVVKASEEDIGWLYPDEPLEQVARRWRDSGPRLVVVTLGGKGAYALGPDGEVRVPAGPVRLVDTVGAGDAFSAGLVDALHRADLLGPAGRPRLAELDPQTLTGLVEHAVLVAALTCEREGADPPTRAEVAAGLPRASATTPPG